MCLIVIAIDQDENFPFIFLSNRDEFYHRPTQSMHWWDDNAILAGKDLQAGGTWLGIHSDKKIAAVTNYRDPERNDPNAPSRGAIPTDILIDSPVDFEKYVLEHQSFWETMNGFNLLYHNGTSTYYYSNISKEIILLSKGIHAVSNAFMNTPWPKVIHSKASLQDIISQGKISEDFLIQLLSNPQRYPEDLLPDTGVGIEMEKMLSAVCIESPVYGTRTHTVILKDKKGHLHITEQQTLSQETIRFVIRD